MLRFTALAILAATQLVHARLDVLQGRGHVEECCPCPASGSSENTPQTVTVTVPAGPPQTTTVYISQGTQIQPSKETVTIERTVTGPGQTIYVTKEPPMKTASYGYSDGEPSQYYEQPPSEKIVTLTGSNGHKIVTKTIVYDGGDGEESHGPKTVTINVSNEHRKTVTVQHQSPSKETGEATSYGSDGDTPKTITQTNSHDGSVTKTIQNGDDGGYYTVVIKPEPSTKTIVQDNGEVVTETIDHYVTVTAAPETETLTRNINHYYTITTTLPSTDYGDDNIVIIINDPSTGKPTCRRKRSGKPCHVNVGQSTFVDYAEPTGYPAPNETSCGPVEVSTSISTVFNTVIVTASSGMPQNTTSTMVYAQPSGKNIRARIPRGPMSMLW